MLEAFAWNRRGTPQQHQSHHESRPPRRQWRRRTASTSLGAAIGAVLSATPAFAQFPPFPDSIGPGSLPSTRAAAAAALLAAPGQPGPIIATPDFASPEVRVGGFSYPQVGPAAPAQPNNRPWQVVPSLGLQLLATDNLFQSTTNRRSDLVTTITPGVLLSADTSWLRGLINYTPNVQLYANTTSQDRVDHRFNGQALATIIPGLFFVDMRGASAVQTITGGLAPESGLVTTRQNLAQTTSAQISPYLLQRFGTRATVQAGYAFQYSDQTGNSSRLNQPSFNQNGLINGQPVFGGQSFTAHEVYGVARTGPDFGRLALEARGVNTNYFGTGVLDGAYRRSAALEARYAIVRGISALVEGGYEQQRYAGTPGVRIDGPIWAVGARFDLLDSGQITVKYGRRDGFDSGFLNASIPIGGRTMLSARYSETLTTSSQRAVDLLSSTTLDALGNPIDLFTGGPLVQPFTNPFLGTTSSLTRVRSATGSLVQRWARDTFILSVTQENRSPVSLAPGTSRNAQRGMSGSFSWLHAFSARTNGIAFVQYGEFETSLNGKGDIVSGSFTVAHQLQERLSGTVQIGTTSRADATRSGRATQNIILLGLRQTF